jgi:hypothetical protein
VPLFALGFRSKEAVRSTVLNYMVTSTTFTSIDAVFLLFFSVIANTDEIYAQKLRVAYTAFAGTFTILWVGNDAGLYLKHGADMDLLFIGSSTAALTV